mmetsp:Transcript_21057/g.24296  ORF Transcript_21057/g.24296 Transcript_21057/m.24296 type:complete len:84 (-) Transcript_21057:14-265(-)
MTTSLSRRYVNNYNNICFYFLINPIDRPPWKIGMFREIVKSSDNICSHRSFDVIAKFNKMEFVVVLVVHGRSSATLNDSVPAQ